MFLPALWLSLLLLAAPPGRAADGPILVLGDSLSAAHNMAVEAGWVALLGDWLGQTDCALEVVNASVSGETTSGGLSRLPALLDRHQPSIVILELGANDGLRGQPLDHTRGNLRRMIELAQGAGASVLLAGIRIPTNYGRRYAEAFAAIYGELAAEYGAALVPFLLEGIALDESLMQSDRIHPRAEAQPRVLANVLPSLGALVSGCEPELVSP